MANFTDGDVFFVVIGIVGSILMLLLVYNFWNRRNTAKQQSQLTWHVQPHEMMTNDNEKVYLLID